MIGKRVLPPRSQEARAAKKRCERTHTKLLRITPEEGTRKGSQGKPGTNAVHSKDLRWNGGPKGSSKDLHYGRQGGEMSDATWFHMFNATLLGFAWLWFDELPPESVDCFKDLMQKFLAHYLQQKRYIRDPVELHHVKQKDGESTEAFMKGYTSESLMLDDNIPKTVDEMMSVTKAFIRGEKAAANQSKRKGQPWKQPDFQKPRLDQGFEQKEDFRRRLRDRRGDRAEQFTPLTKTPKEILDMEAGKGTFTTPPLMIRAPESRNKNKYYDFHEDKGHNTDDCLHLKRQMKEVVRSRQLAPLVKEIKQGSNKASTSKSGKKTEVPQKDKGAAIFMVQSWGRNVQTQSIVHTPPQLNIYLSPTQQYGHRRPSHSHLPEIRRNLIPAATPLIGLSGKITWPLGQILLRVSLGKYPYQSTVWINFLVVRSTSRYNRILERLGICALGVVPSTAHGMIKFPTRSGVPRTLAEHKLGIKENIAPVKQKKRGQASERSYHQIQMAEEDKEETAFHTSQGVFCYTKMPFRIKMLGETKGTFLGHTISKEGVWSCNEKAQAVINMSSPRTLKEVQSLNGKLASLNRFLSKSAEKSLPFFKTLKCCIKKCDFVWTEEAQKALLFTDGSSIEGGSGARLILINPIEMEFTYALRFEFKASNNKAEYEALPA
ncbi:hypothetical protein Tco_0365281 [Tanacetum coccineum]